tara:strand:+ start:805 stop:1518 length:714 start_codon:yes stop_codon:yes gene_type:complete
MSFLILVRHGQSVWNLENKFTGWVNVDLTEKGKLEAEKAGLLIRNKNLKIDHFYSSIQLRAKNTLKIILNVLDEKKKFVSAWQLNERHYGAMTGLNKIEIGKQIGNDKVKKLRRAWNVRPDPLNRKSQYHPVNIDIYKEIPQENIPDTESLEDTYIRVLKYFTEEIKHKLENQNVLISAHGNSIRALCKNLFKLDNNKISELEIPTGNPLVIKFNNEATIENCEYLDKDRAKDLLVF